MNIAPTNFLKQSTAAYEAKVLEHGRLISPYPEALSTVRHVIDRCPEYLSCANTQAINLVGSELLSALPQVIQSAGNPTFYSKIRVFLPWMACPFEHDDPNFVMFDQGIEILRMLLSNHAYMGRLKPRITRDQSEDCSRTVTVEEMQILAFGFSQADFDVLFGNIAALSHWHYPAMAKITMHGITSLRGEVTRLILPDNCRFDFPASLQGDYPTVAPGNHDQNLRELSSRETYELAYISGRQSFSRSFLRNGSIKSLLDEALEAAASEVE